jgi:single-strand DNA-binding protein
MQKVIGRLVSDATVNETKDGRKVVNFTIAKNDRFKVKGSNELKQVTNYFQCSYWMGAGIAQHMKKGMLIEAAGRIGVSAWKNASGETKAALTLHVQFIQLHGKAVKAATDATTQNPAPAETYSRDLPF